MAARKWPASRLGALALAALACATPHVAGAGEAPPASGCSQERLDAIRAVGPDEPHLHNRYEDLEHDCIEAGNLALLEVAYWEDAEVRAHQFGPTHGITTTALHNLGIFYFQQGRFGDAEPVFLRAKEAREHEDGPLHRRTLSAQSALATLYEAQGRYAEAEALARHSAEALERKYGATFYQTFDAYSSLANLYQALGRYPEAASVIEHIAAEIERSTRPWDQITVSGPDDPRLLFLRSQLGDAFVKLGRSTEAEALYKGILDKTAQYGDAAAPLAAQASAGLADLYVAQARYGEAEPLYLKALAPHLAASEQGGLEIIRPLLGTARLIEARGGDAAKSAYFLGQAVNVLQGARANMRELANSTQQAFLQKWLPTYTDLQTILVRQGRFAEAEQVGRMIKDTEYQLFVRGDDTRAAGEALALSRQDREWRAQLAGWIERPNRLAAEIGSLKQKARSQPLSATEERQLGDLEAAYEASYGEFRDTASAWLSAVRAIPDEIAQEEARAIELAMIERRQGEVAAIGSDVALLQAVALEDGLHLFLVTPQAFKHVAVPIARAEVFAAIFAARQEIDAVRADPHRLDDPDRSTALRSRLNALYDLLVAPVAADLADAGTATLMLNLQGQLRYVPFAALWDGSDWLTRRFRLALYTPAANTSFVAPSSMRRADAFGLTLATPGFSRLPGVQRELATIMGGPGSPGVLEGPPFKLDAAFDRAALEGALAQPPPILHVASHFKIAPGDEAGSFLVLGDGSHLSLAEISRSSRLRFRGVELLTLSACETALGGEGTGMEIEGLGALAQNKGAGSVLATLWQVSDASTPVFMETFYRAMADGRLDKAAALQAAQSALIASEEFTDPFFWAPFILMGNWK